MAFSRLSQVAWVTETVNLDVILEPKSPAAQGWWKEEYFLTRDAAHAQAGSSSCCSSHFAKGIDFLIARPNPLPDLRSYWFEAVVG